MRRNNANVALDAARLFNCCTGGVAPDWHEYDLLEIGGCRTEYAYVPIGEEFTIGGQCIADAEFFTVYGRRGEGDWETIADAPTAAEAMRVGAVLSVLSGLPVRLAMSLACVSDAE